MKKKLVLEDRRRWNEARDYKDEKDFKIVRMVNVTELRVGDGLPKSEVDHLIHLGYEVEFVEAKIA